MDRYDAFLNDVGSAIGHWMGSNIWPAVLLLVAIVVGVVWAGRRLRDSYRRDQSSRR